LDAPTFVGVRLQEFEITATTLIELEPQDAAESAGLVAFMDSSHRVELRVVSGAEGPRVELRVFLERLESLLSSVAILASTAIGLRVETHMEFLHFSTRLTKHHGCRSENARPATFVRKWPIHSLACSLGSSQRARVPVPISKASLFPLDPSNHFALAPLFTDLAVPEKP
jgi:hypothetical protein